MLFAAKSSDNATKGESSVPVKTPKPLSTAHAHKLESRIKMELIEQGVKSSK